MWCVMCDLHWGPRSVLRLLYALENAGLSMEWNRAPNTTHIHAIATANDTQAKLKAKSKFSADQTNVKTTQKRSKRRERENVKDNKKETTSKTNRKIIEHIYRYDKHAEYFMMNAYNNFHYIHFLFPLLS